MDNMFGGHLMHPSNPSNPKLKHAFKHFLLLLLLRKQTKHTHSLSLPAIFGFDKF